MAIPTQAEINTALLKLQNETAADFVKTYIANAAISIVKLGIGEDTKALSTEDEINMGKFVKQFSDRYYGDEEVKGAHGMFDEIAEELTAVAQKEVSDKTTKFLDDFNNDRATEILNSPSWYNNIRSTYFAPIQISSESAYFGRLQSFVRDIVSNESEDVVNAVKDQLSDDIQNAQAKKQIITAAVNQVSAVKQDATKEFDEMQTQINPEAETPAGDTPPADPAAGGTPPPADPAAPPADPATPPTDTPPADPVAGDPPADPAAPPADTPPADPAAPPVDDIPPPADTPPAEGGGGKKITITIDSESLTPLKAAEYLVPVSPAGLRMKIQQINQDPTKFLADLESLMIESGVAAANKPLQERLAWLERNVKVEHAREKDDNLIKSFESFSGAIMKSQQKIYGVLAKLDSAGLTLRGPQNPKNPKHAMIAKAFVRRRCGKIFSGPDARTITSFESAIDGALDIVELTQNGTAAHDPQDIVKREESIYSYISKPDVPSEDKALIYGVIGTKSIPLDGIVGPEFLSSTKDYFVKFLSEDDIQQKAYTQASVILSKELGRDLSRGEEIMLGRAVSGDSLTVSNENLYERFIVSYGSKAVKAGMPLDESISRRAKVMTATVYALESLGLMNRADRSEMLVSML